LAKRKGLNLLSYPTGYFLITITVQEAEGEGCYVATTGAAHAAAKSRIFCFKFKISMTVVAFNKEESSIHQNFGIKMMEKVIEMLHWTTDFTVLKLEHLGM